MFVYSKEILRFVSEVTFAIRDILAREVGLTVGRNRFYRKNFSYPIAVVVYNGKTTLGYFDPEFYELGFNECLIHCSKEELQSVIRHEIAHYLTFIEYGKGIMPHGDEFKLFCKKMGWGEKVSKATFCLERDTLDTGGELSQKGSVVRKAQKLLALSKSSNKNEAEQALIKSQQLLLKHNIDSISSSSEEKIFFKRILTQKKVDGKLRAIAKILSTFFVTVVFHKGERGTCLEILGDSVNIEIAEYVAHFLDSELDNLWKEAQKTSFLKGVTPKNSFFLGIAKGYCAKIHFLQKHYNQEVANSLLVIEKKLIHAQKIIYPRLSQAKCRNTPVSYTHLTLPTILRV